MHCSFVLLAEFHVTTGAQLKYQFPQPLGIDEDLLVHSMLPDGAETQVDDWTVFFLNQTPFNTISPVLALDTSDADLDGPASMQTDDEDLLCVLNLVRTKLDKTEDRGAKVRALAICTRHPFIQIFKPVLLMALDDYFSDPSQAQDCLARLFDAVNAMDLSGAPILTRHEKIVMRASERKDIFAEKFTRAKPATEPGVTGGTRPRHRPTNSGESYSSFEEDLFMRQRRESGKERHADASQPERTSGTKEKEPTVTDGSQHQHHHSSSRQLPSAESSFTLGGSAVWVGDESGLDLVGGDAKSMTETSTLASTLGRTLTDLSSSSGHLQPQTAARTPAYDPHLRVGIGKDTHFYHTSIAYKGHQLPIKMPLFTFPEEVGEYSLITLMKVFHSHQLVSGPLHPHLHVNGFQTHPIVILFNALVTGKRIIFLGHKRPAGEVSTFVLSACALGSGCGSVLRGFIERAFPYASLNNRDDWESVPAYIAGVTNPVFQRSRSWDLFLDISTGQVTVSNDIHVNYPSAPTGPSMGGIPFFSRTSTLKRETSQGSEDMKDSGQKVEPLAKSDNADNIFIEDIRSAIESHFGESLVRTRFTEYAIRFVRLASRYEEETLGSTSIGYPSTPFSDLPDRPPQLGSGIIFNDEAAGMKELMNNASRIEGWRKTNTYQYCVRDFKKAQSKNSITGFDVLHQLFRLKHAKNMPDGEVALMMRTLADNLGSYDQVVELLAYLTSPGGGLLHLSFGLLHQKEAVRESTVDIFDQLRQHPVGVMFLQTLNHFQRYAYVRLARAREQRALNERPPNYPPHFVNSSRTLSSRSDLGSVSEKQSVKSQ